MSWDNQLCSTKYHAKKRQSIKQKSHNYRKRNWTTVLEALNNQLLNAHNNIILRTINVLMFCRQRNFPGAAWNCCSKVRFYAAARILRQRRHCERLSADCPLHAATSSSPSDECGDDRRTVPQRTRALPESHTLTEDTNWTWGCACVWIGVGGTIIIIRTRSQQRTVALSILRDHQPLSRPLVQWDVRPWEHHTASCFLVFLVFSSSQGGTAGGKYYIPLYCIWRRHVAMKGPGHLPPDLCFTSPKSNSAILAVIILRYA